MKISIITICYNNEKDIRPTLESVINQTYHNIEYIIVDGVSKDKTLEIINEYKYKITKIISESDNGLYDAINKGIKSATGDVVGLIHAGDKLHDNEVIAKIATHFEENDIDIAYGYSKTINQNGKCIRINKSPEYEKWLVKYGWMPSHQSIYIKRDVFNKYGYYDLDFHPFADYELFIRFFYFNDLKVKLIKDYILYFSLGGTSTGSIVNSLKWRNLIYKAWEKNGRKAPKFLSITKFLWRFTMWYNALIFNK